MVFIGYVLYLSLVVTLGWVPAAAGAAGIAGLCLCNFAAAQAHVMASARSPVPIRHPPPSTPGPDEQPAWRQYFFGQALADLRYVVDEVIGGCERQLRRFGAQITDFGFGSGSSVWTWPLGVLGWAGLIAGAVAGAVAVAVLVAVHGTVVLIVQGVALALIYLLRFADSALLQVKHVRITCPSCHHRVPYPAYACPGAPACRRRHRDVRPGRYGVFRRTCACGARLPTLLLLGSDRLEAYCPWCEKPLVERAGTAAEIILPVFGATNAGKTRLMLTTVLALSQLDDAAALSMRFADKDTERRFDVIRPRLARGDATPPTSPGELPKAYSLHVTPAKGAERFVHLFDAAGERFASADGMRELRYLERAQSFLFVIDPLAIDSLWRSLAEHERRRLDHLHRVAQPPELVFHQTSDHLERIGVPTKRARLGVAISKADLVERLAALDGIAGDSRRIESWLDERAGLGNMVRAMHHRFGEVRFFLTAAVLDGGAVDHSVLSLMGWLFEGERLPLP
jgi:hypothetical protein